MLADRTAHGGEEPQLGVDGVEVAHSGSVAAPLAPRNSPLGYSVRSTTAALAAFVFTDSMPYSDERRNKTGSGLLASVALLRETIER
jgi:hypothetical protein